MQTAIIYTFSNLTSGEPFDLWYYTNDWGTFNTFQVAPSYNQGENYGQVSITSVVAYMPDQFMSPQLIYIVSGINTSEGGTFDVYNAWQ
jgi:hypothetical protein